MTLTILSQETSLLVKKSFHMTSAFHCLAIGFDLVCTHFNRMICCMFSLYKPSLPDYLSKKDEFHLNSLSQEAWGLITTLKNLFMLQKYIFHTTFLEIFLFKQLFIERLTRRILVQSNSVFWSQFSLMLAAKFYCSCFKPIWNMGNEC